jgi:glycosyltransferase involved in cell wall biosynthesis
VLLSSAGSVRNILGTAAALSDWAEVTLAFRSIAEPLRPDRIHVEAIAPCGSEGSARDDVAARGLNPFGHLGYLRTLREFARRSAGHYDLVLEKGWRLSGYLARAFAAQGVPAILIENDARVWNGPVGTPRAAARFLAHCAAQAVAGYCSRRLPVIAAETEQLKSALVVARRIAPERISVVPLGVDHRAFRPQNLQAERSRLGMRADAVVMLYVGGMDQYHNLSPLLEALRRQAPAGLELHLVGDGEYRARYEELARGLPIAVVFHGQMPHAQVPDYIAAADVCLAPYHAAGFHQSEVAFSTLKIPEYMACERPVISVPSGNIRALITDGVNGFLFNNEVDSWCAFLGRFPGRDRLAVMGRAAGPAVEHLNWHATARRYLELAGWSDILASPGGHRNGESA